MKITHSKITHQVRRETSKSAKFLRTPWGPLIPSLKVDANELS